MWQGLQKATFLVSEQKKKGIIDELLIDFMPEPQLSMCYMFLFDMFDSIPEEERMPISESLHGDSIPKGTTIYTPHEELNKIYLLKQGEVVLYHSHEGKTEIFDTLSPGALFGNFQLDPQKPSHFAATTRETVLCGFSTEDFSTILSKRPELTMKFIEKMATRIADYERRFKNSLYTAKFRIYDELKRLEEKKNNSFFGKLFDKKVPIRLTHEEIAKITGLNRVTVTRSLKELKEEGLVSVDSESGVIEIHEKTS